MLTNRDKQVIAQVFKRFQSNLVSPAHAGMFSLTAMIGNLQSSAPERQRLAMPEVITTLNQVAGTLANMAAEDAGTPSKDSLNLLGGIVALCADVLCAETYAGYSRDGGGHEND